MKHTITIVLLLCGTAQANPQSAVQIVERGRSTASAVMIDGGYALTAEHVVVMGGNPLTVKGLSAVPQNKPPLDQTDDAVLLRVDGYDGPYSRIAAGPPSVGDKVHTVGYPSGKRTELSGRVTRVYDVHRSEKGKGLDSAYAIETDIVIHPGHSGGPLWNEAGELIGLASLSASDGKGNHTTPSLWIGTQSIHNALKITQRSIEFATLDPNKPDLVVFTSVGCLPCEPIKDEVKAGGYSEWNVIFAEWDELRGKWNTPWQYVNGAKEFHAELSGVQLMADFRKHTKVKGRFPTPTMWARYTDKYSMGRTGLRAWAHGVLAVVRDLILGEPAPRVAVPENTTPFAPAEPYERSPESSLEGLKAKVDDLVAFKDQAKETLQTAKELKDAGLIGKVKAGLALKSDVAELKEQAGGLKDSWTELKDGLKDPRAIANVLWGVLGWMYRRKKGGVA